MNSIMFWVPRCAGTSIYRALKPNGMYKVNNHTNLHKFIAKGNYLDFYLVTFGHWKILDLIKAGKVPKDYYNNAFKFTFVRNPYDRFMSLYHYTRSEMRPKERVRFETQEDFVERLRQGIDPPGFYNFENYSTCNPQTSWLLDDKGKLIPNFVGRVENIGEDFSNLCDILKINKYKLRQFNAHKQIRQKITQTSRDFVEEFYQKDFEIFYNDL